MTNSSIIYKQCVFRFYVAKAIIKLNCDQHHKNKRIPILIASSKSFAALSYSSISTIEKFFGFKIDRMCVLCECFYDKIILCYFLRLASNSLLKQYIQYTLQQLFEVISSKSWYVWRWVKRGTKIVIDYFTLSYN
jgi:hypothetical protein